MNEISNALQMTYVVLRLNRWGVYVRWLTSGGSDPRPPRLTSWWGKLVMEPNVEQSDRVSLVTRECPVDIDEARETEACVRALPEHLKRTMIEEYLVRGTADQKAQALAIEVRAFRYRRDRAHNLLLGLFNDAAAGLPLEVEEPITGRPPMLVKKAA
jgi:hypothetical protein